ncbi:DUF2771 domain-containing protein [Streptomyces iconiensis]|uniref:DUF2771 domain-containing protein n=1 Tax=Streptomyces iconiensis TaxID=1384038 RepID=A0ABT7A9X8_9ACTN|nr:DUF2771 domain-containing protein [Streptomyces iconiensis]MDJ1138143.1 DUF2771 domain-containing protein [Streptomyces iconiensis]
MSIATRRSRTSSQSPRTVRTATAIGAVSLGLLALSACEKPTPMVTATVGSDAVSSEAACYDDGKAIPEKDVRSCMSETPGKSVTISSGDKLRVGVDPEMADHGWLVLVDGKPAMSDAMKKTYYSFQGEAFFQEQPTPGQQPKAPKKSVKLSVAEVTDGQFTGIWHFTVKNDAAS